MTRVPTRERRLTRQTVRGLLWLRPRAQRLCVLIVPLFLLGVLPLAARVDLDLSFNPLLRDDAVLRDATERLRATFGERGSGMVGVLWVADRPDALTTVAATDAHAALTRSLQAMQKTRLVVSAATLPADAPPAMFAAVHAQGGAAKLIWIDLDLPLEDLAARREHIAAIEDRARDHTPHNVTQHLVGYSVVETAYARILLKGAATAAGLTCLVLAVLLWLSYRAASAVVVAFAGVGLGLPLTLAVLSMCALPITLLSAALPTLLLMVGVVDAIHLLHAYSRRRQAGVGPRGAVRGTLYELLMPCALTTVTTAVGFLALVTASLPVIRDFGLAVTLGVLIVHGLNVVFLPLLLWHFPFVSPPPAENRTQRRQIWLAASLRRPWAWVLAPALVFGLLTVAAPSLRVVQYFNEDVAPGHPLRVAQDVLSSHFPGFLGPDILITRTDDGTLLEDDALAQLWELHHKLAVIPDVDQVVDLPALLPATLPTTLVPLAVAEARSDDEKRAFLAAVLAADNQQAAVSLRVGDVGTERALTVITAVETAVAETLRPPLRGEVAGHWVHAQQGMASLLRDMFTSFATALAGVLPFLWLAARSRRLLLAAVLPNLLPMVGALGVMALTGISLRIGTCVVFAVALGIAVDDTIHMVAAVRRGGPTPTSTLVAQALQSSGRAIVLSSALLIAGFLSLWFTPLTVLQDMGLVGAAAMGLALLADVVMLPGLLLVTARRRRQKA